MKKAVSFLLTLSMMLCAVPNLHAVSTVPESPGWQLVFQDEFEGTTINPQYWNTFDPNLSAQDYYFYANSPETIVCPENVSVSNGMLKLHAEYAPMQFGGATHDYRTGTLQSRGKVELTYGLYEAKIKMPDLPGSNPAFWLMPHHDGTNFSFIGLGGTGAEVDILEHLYTDNDHYQTTVHWGGYESNHKSWTASPKPYMGSMHDWHVFGVEWAPSFLKFMVDGNVVATYTGEAVPYGPEFIILSLGLGGWIGQPDRAKMPADMLVDYVRVYQRTDKIENGRYVISSEFSGKALEVSSAAAGAAIVQKIPSQSTLQQWDVQQMSDGTCKITNVATGLSLDVYGQQTQNNAPIIQWNDEGRANQRWLLEASGSGSFYLINQNSKKVADVAARSTQDGAKIIQYENNRADNQRWRFSKLG